MIKQSFNLKTDSRERADMPLRKQLEPQRGTSTEKKKERTTIERIE